MSAQAQKFEFFEKKLSLGVRSPWDGAYGLTLIAAGPVLNLMMQNLFL